MGGVAVDQVLARRALNEVLAAGRAAQVAALEVLVEALTRPDEVEPEAPVLADLSVRLAQAGHQLSVVRSSWLSRVEADGRWSLDAARTFAHWVAWSHGTTLRTARRDVRRARTLDQDLPATRAAALAGQIGPDHVWTMVSVAATSSARTAALAAPSGTDPHPDEADGAPQRTGEQVLVDLARQHRPEPFTQIVRHFAALADPEATDRAFADAAEREFLTLDQTIDGFHLAGFLTTEHGQTLSTALRAVAGVPSAEDHRTPTQRRAHTLTALARTVLDHGLAGTGAAVRPHLNVTVSWTELTQLLATVGTDPTTGAPADTDPATGQAVDWDTVLARPPAQWVDDTGPIPQAVLARLACDSTISRIVFGPDSQILNVGRRERTLTGARRTAVISRDRHCVWPGCTTPPAHCEVHHAHQTWAHGGPTSTDNAALLCAHHHTHVDTNRITMTRTHGTWHFHHRNGSPITDPYRPRTQTGSDRSRSEGGGERDNGHADSRVDDRRSAA